MTVGVVITTHEGAGAMVRHCVAAVVNAGDVDLVVVVDNSGHNTAGVGETVDSEAYGGGVDCALHVDNLGFGAAANAGFRYVIERLGDNCMIALLNDDVVVSSGWLGPLKAVLDGNERIGAVQPKLLISGTEPALVNSVGVVLDHTGAGTDIGYREPDGPIWNTSGPIELFSGGAVLLSAAFIDDLDGFDERYFLYYEDVDLSLRGAERRWAFHCATTSVVTHAVGASAVLLGDDLRRIQDRNRLWVAFRFGSTRVIAAALWLSIRRLRHQPRRIHARALVQGVAGAPTRLLERRRAGQQWPH